MSSFQFHVQAGENGSVVLPVTPFLAGDNLVIIAQKEHFPEAENDDDDLFLKKSIRNNRLEDRFDEKTPEERKAAAIRFMELWDGALVGLPDMTMREIRAERINSRCEE